MNNDEMFSFHSFNICWWFVQNMTQSSYCSFVEVNNEKKILFSLTLEEKILNEIFWEMKLSEILSSVLWHTDMTYFSESGHKQWSCIIFSFDDENGVSFVKWLESWEEKIVNDATIQHM